MAQYTSTKTVAQSLTATLFKSLYMQMSAALAITGLVAYFLSQSDAYLNMLINSSYMLWIILFAQLGVVIWLSSSLHKLSMTSATLLFILYSVLTGVSFGSIFLVYEMSQIVAAFFVTAGTFFVTSLVGYVTRMDLSKMGSILMMLLIGLIIATVVNMFLGSEGLYMACTYIGVIVFVGLTAWDTQRIKSMFMEHGTADDNGQKLALMGALMLYLDFINLFIYMLRLLSAGRE
ncbi:MAG: Bax inhibitor-1/YccA family protein [Alistipes sp.]|nr:Bax inhibitor-1/YccA family protein [Alistipes sp.]